MSFRARNFSFALAGCIAMELVTSASAFAQDQLIDWRAYGRASALSVAQALPSSDEECKEIDSIEENLAKGLSGWRLPDVDHSFFVGLYEGYVDELRIGREQCGLGESLPGVSIGRVVASVASAMWEGSLRDAKPEVVESSMRTLGEAVDFKLSDSEQALCDQALRDNFFEFSNPSRDSIETGEMNFDSLLAFMLIPWELSELVCHSSGVE